MFLLIACAPRGLFSVSSQRTDDLIYKKEISSDSSRVDCTKCITADSCKATDFFKGDKNIATQLNSHHDPLQCPKKACKCLPKIK